MLGLDCLLAYFGHGETTMCLDIQEFVLTWDFLSFKKGSLVLLPVGLL